MSIVGIIFSNVNDGGVLELSTERAIGSVPFGGRYRIIDGALSCMVNSGATKVGVITQDNYQSLMDHVGSGKDWDLARKSGGLILLPPFGEKDSTPISKSKLVSLRNAKNFLAKSNEEYVVLSDCDCIYNMDFDDVIKYHEEKNADITIVYKNRHVNSEQAKIVKSVDVNCDGRVIDLADGMAGAGNVNQFTKVVVMKRQLLQMILSESTSHGKTEFFMDVLFANLKTMKIYGYAYEGYFETINSLNDYYTASMGLLEKEKRDLLFNQPNSPIYTKVKDSPPTLYGDHAVVKNSFIADGCVIEGIVENSVIFRGTKISKDAVVKNSVVMQDSFIGEKAYLNAVITDKNVTVHDKVVLSGHGSMPFYIRKNASV